MVLADEPTGNLDSKASQDVMEILTLLNKEEKATMMLVTHDPVAASFCDRIIFIKDGQLYNEVCYNDDRPLFYKNIMEGLSMFGGNKHDFSTARIQ
ncbi:ABC transporter ATP-binding protein yxdL (plasmid) [Bacillus thuringiensis MC28]|nr:ABC transporter ATP-binding protein yxdL [Bacillus thuringiensis MC28]